MSDTELYIERDGAIEKLGDVQGFEWHTEPAMQLWLVLFMPTTAQEALAIVGIFDTEEAARDACITPQHVMGAVRLNVDYNCTQHEWWPGAVYPIAAQYTGDITAGGGEIAGIGVMAA